MDEDDDVDVAALRAEAKPARQARRDYGPFQQRDVLAALGAVAEPRRGSPARRAAGRTVGTPRPRPGQTWCSRG